MTAIEAYETWKKKVDDRELLNELDAMSGDSDKIAEAFYKELEFGTAGMRGKIGAGTNCLNVYTIRRVTQGIADYMRAKKMTAAAISYDSRIKSDSFAATVAEVFAANGIKAYLSEELMPTPFLSYMVRSLGADVGVMITASHNPAVYNGYKVYGADGCQLTDAAANELIGYVNAVDPFKVKVEKLDKYLVAGLVEYAGERLREEYLCEVGKRSLGSAEGLNVVFSPLNGTGYKLVPEILKRVGVSRLTVVKEQAEPDGNFPTCPYPNPEKKEALKLGLELAEKMQADLLIATDPDCDRMGLAVKSGDGYRLLTGNETGVLLTDFIFSVMSGNGTLPKKPVLVKTIVTTSLAAKVAEKYGAEVKNVLTGFKYIGDVIAKLEAKGEAERFVLGFEESYGYLSGSYVRDKDAVVASMLAAEMAAHYKRGGKTLADRLDEIYAEYGTYSHKTLPYEFPGVSGAVKMKKLLGELHANTPKSFGGSKVIKVTDYLTQTEFDLPKADVLSYEMENGSALIVRPSGTEPLIKMYITACKTPDDNKRVTENIIADLDAFFK